MAGSAVRSFAVVTGASTGIGYHLARTFAENEFDVLVTSEGRSADAAVQDLEALGARVYNIPADLTKDEEVERLWKEVLATGRPVDVIAINAGVEVPGDSIRENDLEAEFKSIDLSVKTTIHLAHLAAKQMAGRRTGRILITAPTADMISAPLQAVDGATKAFDLEFAQGFRNELRDTGITVTMLKPETAHTELFRRDEIDDTGAGFSGNEASDLAQVAQQAFDALMRGEEEVGAASSGKKLAGVSGAFVPDSVKASIHEKMKDMDRQNRDSDG